MQTLATPQSSNIKLVEYDDEHKQLRITFKTGSRYIYFSVPDEIFEGFKGAESKGKFFIANVKNIYKFKRLK